MRYPLVATLAVLLAGCGLIDQINGPGSLSIQRFVASPDEVAAGSSVTLTWNVDGADTAQIDNGVGSVLAKGSKTLTAYNTTTYTLTAKSGTSSATASVQVKVTGSSGDPFAFLGPSPDPGPTPEPSPSPDASPSPTPSPSPSPDAPIECGDSDTSAGGCTVTVEHPKPYEGGQCLEVAKVGVDKECPVPVGSRRDVYFDVIANTNGPRLSWRRGDTSKDDIDPESGFIAPVGTTRVELKDRADSDALAIELVDGEGKVRLRFTLQHR